MNRMSVGDIGRCFASSLISIKTYTYYVRVSRFRRSRDSSILKLFLHDCPDILYGRIGTIEDVYQFLGVIDQVDQLLVGVVLPLNNRTSMSGPGAKATIV